MALTFWSVKGQKLTAEEGDTNIQELMDKPLGQVYPKTMGIGIKIDNAFPDWGWCDLTAPLIWSHDASDPSYEIYQGAIKQLRFDVGKSIDINFHLPHDYAMGTDLFIHFHWSHASGTLTSGSVTGAFEATYAKGHNQGSFVTPVSILASQEASLIRYQHMIAEVPLSAVGGVGGLLDTNNLEVDGLILCNFELTANDMDGGALPFVHIIDIHYQSTGLPTKQKSPDFWI